MDMWEGGNIPGITCQRAHFESPDILDEIRNDHFHDFVRESIGTFDGGRVCNLVKQYTVDSGFAAVPNNASEEIQPFTTSKKGGQSLS